MGLKRFSTAVIVSAVLGALCISRIQADDPIATENIPIEMVKAADSALRATIAQYQFGQSSVEEIYQWSRRLMEAEVANGKNMIDAASDHMKRMEQMLQKAEALFKAGAKGGTENKVHATRYYFLEAKTNALKQK